MKKILRIVSFAILFVFLCPCYSFAVTDPFDPEYVHSIFGDQSIDDLLNMKKLLEIELEYRGYSSKKTETKEFDVPVGKYTIGIDIPAGIYTVSRGSGMFDSIVIIGNYETFYPVSQNSPIGKLELAEGQTIEVQMGGVKFSEYKGIGF